MKWELLSSECLSEFRMDQHLLEQETSAKRQETLSHLRQCERCQEELTWMQQERLAFLSTREALPASLHRAFRETFEDTKEIDKEKQKSWSWPYWLSWTMLATCSLAVLWLIPWREIPPTTSVTTIYRSGDHPVFLVGLKRNHNIRQISSGEIVKPGDRIRLAYRWRTQNPAYLYVLHRDQNGAFSALYPETKERVSLPVQIGEEVFLPGSLEFDHAAQGYEEIWACFSRQPLVYNEVRKNIPQSTGLQAWEPKSIGSCTHLMLFQFQRGQP